MVVMTHTGEMRDSDGTFGYPTEDPDPCRYCGIRTVTCTVWESNDGAYEDFKYECRGCGQVWWVDGIDS